MTSFHVTCSNKNNSCYYGNYDFIGICDNCFKLYSTNKKKKKILDLTINFDDIEKVEYTPELNNKNFIGYIDYNKLLEFDLFFKEKEQQQISIFDFIDYKPVSSNENHAAA